MKVMKRIITSTLLLSALALFSACQKSEQQAPAKGESIVFTASFAPETKTVIDKTGKKSLWNQDEIRIFNGKPSEVQEYVTTAVKAATAEFTIKNPEAKFTGTNFIAVCPNTNRLATEAWWNGSVDKTIDKLYLKPQQTAKAGTYDPEGHVAVAYTENHELSFKNACALLKFTIKSDNIKEVCVYSTGAVLSGNFNFNTEGLSITTTAVDEDTYETNNYVKVKVKGGFVNGQTYYMSCIPATLENGLTLEVVNTDGKKGKDRTTTNKIELKRSKIYDLGDVTYLPIFDYGIVGGFNGWDTSKPLQFVDTDGDGIYECKNVNLKAQEGKNEGFKFFFNNSWLGVHDDFYFDKTITGWYDGLYTNNTGNKTHNIKVSDTSKNWDIYIYAKQEADWGRELAFTILPAGSPTPTK